MQERSRTSAHKGYPVPEKVTYREFLESKIELAQDSGFVVDPEKVNKVLKPHQRDAVVWALKGGRRALFGFFW